MTPHQSTVQSPGGRPRTRSTWVLPSYVWKSAYAILGATVLAVALGIGYFTYEGIFGPVSDGGALLVGILLAPLVWGMYLVHRDSVLNGVVLVVGIATTAGIVIGSSGLIVMYLLSLDPDIVGSWFLGIQFLGWLVLGFWLLGVGMLGLRDATVARRVSWAAIVAGVGTAGAIVTLVYSYAVGSFTLVFPMFMGLYFVGFVLWAFWLGRELRNRTHQAVTAADV